MRPRHTRSSSRVGSGSAPVTPGLSSGAVGASLPHPRSMPPPGSVPPTRRGRDVGHMAPAGHGFRLSRERGGDEHAALRWRAAGEAEGRTLIAGRYDLDREIGRGGMGAVWLGRDTVLGREVALKRIGMIPGATSPDFERAEREARLAARLNHPHVVAVFDLV